MWMQFHERTYLILQPFFDHFVIGEQIHDAFCRGLLHYGKRWTRSRMNRLAALPMGVLSRAVMVWVSPPVSVTCQSWSTSVAAELQPLAIEPETSTVQVMSVAIFSLV